MFSFSDSQFKFHSAGGNQIEFMLSDEDSTGDPTYKGYLTVTGAWMIIRTTSAGATRYAAGKTGYAAAWTDKANQDYGYFDAKF